MTARVLRQQALAERLRAAPLGSQEDCLAYLAGRGFPATQATVSRDLRELGAVKGPAGYVLPDEPVGAEAPGMGASSVAPLGAVAGALPAVVRGYVRSVSRGGTLVVLKTGPGQAQVVALELDRRPPPGVIGTVGGDDTIFVACSDEQVAGALQEELGAMAGVPGVAGVSS